MTLQANEVLGAFQLGIINANEARVALGFKEIESIKEEEKETNG
jgi:hypothetical protein